MTRDAENVTGPAERSWSFSLPYTRPPAGLAANDRPGHWSIRARSTAEVRQRVFYAVRALHVGVCEKIRINVEWVVKDHRKRDTDGPDPLCKAIYDGICSDRGLSARVVDDDTPEFVDKPRLTIRYEAGVVPHFQVTITEIE